MRHRGLDSQGKAYVLSVSGATPTVLYTYTPADILGVPAPSIGIPDALSKTIPIWIAVMNRTLFPNLPSSHRLHTPPQAVSPSEAAQIEQRLDGFVKLFRVSAWVMSVCRC